MRGQCRPEGMAQQSPEARGRGTPVWKDAPARGNGRCKGVEVETRLRSKPSPGARDVARPETRGQVRAAGHGTSFALILEERPMEGSEEGQKLTL